MAHTCYFSIQRLGQEDCTEFKVSQGYTMSSSPVYPTEQDPVSVKQSKIQTLCFGVWRRKPGRLAFRDSIREPWQAAEQP